MQLDQQPVQHTQLATLPQQLCLVRPIVWGVAQGRVVAHLAQLHALVVQGGEVVAVGFADAGVEGGEAEGAGTFDPVVDNALVGCHSHMHRQRHLQSGFILRCTGVCPVRMQPGGLLVTAKARASQCTNSSIVDLVETGTAFVL